MNQIPHLQNMPRHLRELAAQRQLYAKAKQVFGWQFVVAGPLTCILGVSALAFPNIKEFIALWGIVVVLVDLFWVTPWQKRLRENAAKIQELFDCAVLGLTWNPLKTGPEPEPELIKEQADLYEPRRSQMPPLENWYPVSVGELPLRLGRLICQRSNCWWDSKQRRHYAGFILFLTITIFVTVLLLALKGGLLLSDFLLQVVAPMSPVLLFGLRQFCDQRDSANRLDKLKTHAETTWKKALVSEDGAEAESRNLQDEIFENRKKAPPVLDRLFRRLRNNFEAQMNHSSEHYVAEAEQALNANAPHLPEL